MPTFYVVMIENEETGEEVKFKLKADSQEEAEDIGSTMVHGPSWILQDCYKLQDDDEENEEDWEKPPCGRRLCRESLAGFYARIGKPLCREP